MRAKIKAIISGSQASCACVALLSPVLQSVAQQKPIENELPSLSLIKNDFSSDVNVEINNNAYVYNSSPVPYYSMSVSMDADLNGFITLDNHSLLEIFINENVAKYFLNQFYDASLVENNLTIFDKLTASTVINIFNKVNTDSDFLKCLNLSKCYKSGEPNYSKESFIKYDTGQLKFIGLNYKLTEASINSIVALNNPNLKPLFKNVKELDLSHNNLIFVPDFNNIFTTVSEIGDYNPGGLKILNLKSNHLTYIDRNLYKIIYSSLFLGERGKILLNHNNMPYYFLSYEFFPNPIFSIDALDLKLCKTYLEYYTLKDVIVEIITKILGINDTNLEPIIEVVLEFIINKIGGNIEAIMEMGTYQTDKNNFNFEDLWLQFCDDFLRQYSLDITELLPSNFLWYNSANEFATNMAGKWGSEATNVLFNVFYPFQHSRQTFMPVHLNSSLETFLIPPGFSWWLSLNPNDYKGSLNIAGNIPFYISNETTSNQINAIEEGIKKGFTFNSETNRIELTGEIDIKPLTDYIATNIALDRTIHFATLSNFPANQTVTNIAISIVSVLGATALGITVWFFAKKHRERKKRNEIFGKEEK